MVFHWKSIKNSKNIDKKLSQSSKKTIFKRSGPYMGVMECQIPPQLADTSGSHQLLDGEIAEDAEQAVIGVTHEIVEMIRGKEAETGGRATTGRSSSSESGSRW